MLISRYYKTGCFLHKPCFTQRYLQSNINFIRSLNCEHENIWGELLFRKCTNLCLQHSQKGKHVYASSEFLQGNIKVRYLQRRRKFCSLSATGQFRVAFGNLPVFKDKRLPAVNCLHSYFQQGRHMTLWFCLQ